MLKWLQHPLPTQAALCGALALLVATAFYCVSYNALAGRTESVGAGLAWGAVNVVPWWLAFEAGKRADGWPARCAVAAVALIASLALGLAMAGPLPLDFEAIRRLPAFGAVLALLLLGRVAEARERGKAVANDHLLVPESVVWVKAAGNYIELHGDGRPTMLRGSLGMAEATLARRGFVRVHRSILVRRDRIARIRPADVVLLDGTSLRTGKRYRAALADS